MTCVQRQAFFEEGLKIFKSTPELHSVLFIFIAKYFTEPTRGGPVD
jgi:hypothetical protein